MDWSRNNFWKKLLIGCVYSKECSAVESTDCWILANILSSAVFSVFVHNALSFLNDCLFFDHRWAGAKHLHIYDVWSLQRIIRHFLCPIFGEKDEKIKSDEPISKVANVKCCRSVEQVKFRRQFSRRLSQENTQNDSKIVKTHNKL